MTAAPVVTGGPPSGPTSDQSPMIRSRMRTECSKSHPILGRTIFNPATPWGRVIQDPFPSTIVLNVVRPFSNSPPTILSIFMIRPNALPMKLFFPVMVQVTTVSSC